MVHNHDTDTDTASRITTTGINTKNSKDNDDTIIIPTCYFYMPSGEQVSYCAHAAMGAAYILHTRQSTPPRSKGEILLQTAQGVQTKAIIQRDDVELGIPKHEFREQTVDTKVVERLLDQIGLTMDCVDVDVDSDSDVDVDSDVDSDVDVDSDSDSDSDSDVTNEMKYNEINYNTGQLWPMLNSSVARYKTLIPISTPYRLHEACDPRDPLVFRDLCDSIDSTGVYLYSKVDRSQHKNDHRQEYECRQFPRASGYPEDPATGIAASALACSLYQRGITLRLKYIGEGDGGRYIMYQGTAMGKHSRCNVRVSMKEDMVFCSGTIAIDGEEYLDVDVDVL